MIEEIASIMAPKTGILHNLIRCSLDAGKEIPESRKVKEEIAIQKTKIVQKVSQIPGQKGKIIDSRYWEGLPLIYNTRGKLIDSRYGENIDISS